MAASTNVNNFNIEVIMDHKQHEIPSSENNTHSTQKKRPKAESPENLASASKQQILQSNHL